MFRLKKLFRGLFSSVKCLPKKAYTCGMIVIATCMVTVLTIGINHFQTGNKIINTQTEVQEDDPQEDDELIVLEDDTTGDIVQRLQEASQLQQEKNIGGTLLLKEETSEVVLSTASNQTSSLNTNQSTYSQEDYMALVRIVEAEATSEDIIGKIMVANVVLNRVDSERFPDSIYNVVHQKINDRAQFSPIDDGRYETVTITDSSYEAVDRAINGEDYSNDALFFVARSIASEKAVSWFDNALNKVAEHGVHEFYTY